MGGGDDGLQVVEVVEVDVFQIGDGRVDVAGEGDVDEEDRAISPGFEQRLELLFGDDRMVCAGGGDDHVGGDEVIVQFLEWDGRSAESVGEIRRLCRRCDCRSACAWA